MKLETKWWCERCHASGIMLAPESVYDAIEVLRATHDAHPLAWRGHCVFDTQFVRVELIPDPPSEATP